MSGRYTLGDGSLASRGDRVDWLPSFQMKPEFQRTGGEIVVMDGDVAWVQFPEMQEPCKYPLGELRRAMPPDFRTFCKERGFDWPHRVGETWQSAMARAMDAIADYADELRKAVIR